MSKLKINELEQMESLESSLNLKPVIEETDDKIEVFEEEILNEMDSALDGFQQDATIDNVIDLLAYF